MDASLAFYVGKLGCKVADDTIVRGSLVRFVSQGHYDAMRLVLLKVSSIGSMIELLEFQGDSALGKGRFQPAPHQGSITIMVDELNAWMASLAAQGLEPASDIFEVSTTKLGNSRIVFYFDPDGHMLEFFEARKSRHA
jgi:catechol 2,3-dioxygenase-like lactoylglutathione lyase family enzyme